MFGNKKIDSFFNFYYSIEGKKMLALAELFLDEMTGRLHENKIDLAFDYCFSTDEYIFKIIYSDRFKGYVHFFIYDTVKGVNSLQLAFSSTTGEPIDWRSEAFFSHKGLWQSVKAYHYSIFHPLRDKMKPLVIKCYVDVAIVPEKIDKALAIQLETPSDIMRCVRTLLQKNRQAFRKNIFVNVAHTIKQLEQVLPLLHKKNRHTEELKNMITRDLMGILEEYITLSEDKRMAQDEKLLVYMNRFYLKALDVKEFSQ